MTSPMQNDRRVTWPNRLRATLRRHVRPVWQNYQWPAIWLLAIAAMGLGYWGFSQRFAERTPLDLFYLSLQLFLLESGAVTGPIPWQLEVARLLAPLVAGYTATQALAVIFREQLRQLRLRMMSHHVVICGLGRMGSLLARTFHDQGYRVVVIEKDAENDNLQPCREHGAMVLVGNAASAHTLRRARAHQARHLISVCGDDGTNAEVSVHARELVRGRKGEVLTCRVHIVDLNLCRLLREKELATQQVDSFRLEFFNVFENGARAMLKEFPVTKQARDMDRQTPSMLIVGLGRMGGSLVVAAARAWREAHGVVGSRLRIAIVDKIADRKTQALQLQYPQLEKVCELRAFQMDIHSPEFQRAEFLVNEQGECDLTHVYVCIDDDSIGLSAALALLHRVRGRRIPIVVRMTHEGGLSALLHGDGGSSFDNLHAFGLLTRTCKPGLLLGGTHEILARAIHEDYVRHQEKLGQSPKTNPSMVPWEKLPENLKESNRQQSDHLGLKLAAVGCAIAPLTDWDAEFFEFTPEEVETLAKMEYERWREEREREGWKQAPAPKDLDKKTTPHLSSWEQLGEDVKELDRNTVRGLPRFLASAGFQIYRLSEG